MPIYEYECTKCGERFELRRSMADSDRVIRCLRCGAKNPRRVFSTFSTGSTSSSCTPGAST